MGLPQLVVKPAEGQSVWFGGMGVVFKVLGADTGGAFAIVEHPIEPGRLVLPHVHLREDEYSYVLERFTFAWRTHNTSPKRQRGSRNQDPRWRFGLVSRSAPRVMRNACVSRHRRHSAFCRLVMLGS